MQHYSKIVTTIQIVSFLLITLLLAQFNSLLAGAFLVFIVMQVLIKEITGYHIDLMNARQESLFNDLQDDPEMQAFYKKSSDEERDEYEKRINDGK